MEQQLIAFINKYFGIPGVGDTPQNRSQCVGLIEVWLDILGKNTPHLYGNAKDLLSNAPTDKFEVIYNDPNNYDQYPKPGDVLVFGPLFGNGLGHCGVVLRANGYNLSLFEANDPIGATPTITNYRNYAGVEGWLSYK